MFFEIFGTVTKPEPLPTIQIWETQFLNKQKYE